MKPKDFEVCDPYMWESLCRRIGREGQEREYEDLIAQIPLTNDCGNYGVKKQVARYLSTKRNARISRYVIRTCENHYAEA